MRSDVFELFDEYAAAYARGDRPDADEFLARAGGARKELALLLEEFLRRAPAPMPSEDDVRLVGLLLADEPPLLTLRVRRGVKVDYLVDAVIERLALDPAKRPKVKRYYQRLEGGLLDPAGVSNRLRTVLADVFGTSIESALSWTAPTAPAKVLFRSAGLEARASPPALSGCGGGRDRPALHRRPVARDARPSHGRTGGGDKAAAPAPVRRRRLPRSGLGDRRGPLRSHRRGDRRPGRLRDAHSVRAADLHQRGRAAGATTVHSRARARPLGLPLPPGTDCAHLLPCRGGRPRPEGEERRDERRTSSPRSC